MIHVWHRGRGRWQVAGHREFINQRRIGYVWDANDTIIKGPHDKDNVASFSLDRDTLQRLSLSPDEIDLPASMRSNIATGINSILCPMCVVQRHSILSQAAR